MNHFNKAALVPKNSIKLLEPLLFASKNFEFPLN